MEHLIGVRPGEPKSTDFSRYGAAVPVLPKSNQPDAVNHAIALRFHSRYRGRVVTDPER